MNHLGLDQPYSDRVVPSTVGLGTFLNLNGDRHNLEQTQFTSRQDGKFLESSPELLLGLGGNQ